MEGALLGGFMISAGIFATLIHHPDFAIRQWVSSDLLRRMLGGGAMGLTAVALIYSPWGRQSGAHMNPAVTLNFWRLGKLRGRDVAGYWIGQFAGGLLGIVVARLLIGGALAEAPIHWAATVPGRAGSGAAFAGELTISLLTAFIVLTVANHPRCARHTGWVAGLLVAIWITIEDPLSGMSMNPARTFASALPSGLWTGWWIYFTAPVLGMLAGGWLFAWRHGQREIGCPKLIHATDRRCIFCGHLMNQSSSRGAGHRPASGDNRQAGRVMRDASANQPAS